MIMADFHVHSNISFDGQNSMEAMCESAISKGLTEICFTDHHDIYTESFSLDIPRYLDAINAVRERFPELNVRSGIEAGDSPETRGKMAHDLGVLRPDYILLSTHAVDGVDPYFAEEYFTGRTRREGMRAYVEAVLDAVIHAPDYDAIAHLGYAGRYAPKSETPTPLCYDDAPNVIDEIFLHLINNEKALEINTGKETPTPGYDIIHRYKELGGNLIVLGSDAHRSNSIAHRFEQTATFLSSIGFDSYCTFEARTMRLYPF